LSPYSVIRDVVEDTAFIDTHEHLPDESCRLTNTLVPLGCGTTGLDLLGCGDWTILLSTYCCNDLSSSGLSAEAHQRFFLEAGDPVEKFDLIAHHWSHVKHTGYGQAVRRTLHGLYGETDLSRESAPRIAEKYQDMVRPGFYREILQKRCRIENCQVNTLQSCVFWPSEDPLLLRQDIDITHLCLPVAFAMAESEFKVRAVDLDQWLDFIDGLFYKFGATAVAVKILAAEYRRLDFGATDRRHAERVFRRFRTYGRLRDDERKELEDFLIRWCIERAADYGLPVKIHTGIYNMNNDFPITSASNNAGDLFALISDFPEVRFDLFHIGYPYQNEMLALAKHHTNVYLDMCWAWIVDPVASVRFLKSFLTTVPSNKVFAFGGDLVPVELVFGHAEIARHGISTALSELVDEGWLATEEAPEVVERIMRGNALATFGASLT
jgi:predicted TIM-barrel fold metal-dependent hydrolase